MEEKANALSRKRTVGFLLIGIAALLAVTLIGAVSGAAISAAVKKANADRRTECVLKVGETGVTRAQFELFCITVIEGPGFETLRLGTASEKALAAAVKAKAQEYARQYFSLVAKAEESGIALSPYERAEIDRKVNNIPEGEDPLEYYQKNYGVTDEGYRDFLCGWKLCEKYVNYAAGSIVVDDELKREIFEANAEKLGWGMADVIYFDVSSSDPGTAELKRSTASGICDTVNATPDSEKEAVFRSMWESFCEEGFSLSGINVPVTGEIAKEHPGLFEAVRKAAIGYCYMVDDAQAVFAVRIRERYMYETFRDSAELAELVKKELSRRVAEEAAREQKAEPTSLMDTVDLRPLIAARIELNGR